MFWCACSLRSTQCAALIALATAAGISRFEDAPAHIAIPVASQQQEVGNSAVSHPHFYEAAMQSLAPWFHLAGVQESINGGIENDHGDGGGQPAPIMPGYGLTPLPVPPATESPEHRFTRSAAMPTAREHSYPYSVGPPRRGKYSNLRALGTEVPGDSPARRRLVLRIATVSILTGRAPLLRTTDSGPKLAGSHFHPGSALRDEPGFHQSPARPCARWHAAALRGATSFLS